MEYFPIADPFILYHGGKYYLYGTTNAKELEKVFDGVEDKEGFHVFVSSDLKTWEYGGVCLEKGKGAIGEKWFWAPEVIHKNGKFYMTYSSEEHIAVAVSKSPLGPFVQEEKKWLSEQRTIDGSFFFDDDGKAYLYYARLLPETGNTIFGAPLSDDLLTLLEEQEKFLIKAEEEWETKDCLVAEGPQVLKHNGKYYLSYSANHTRCEDYAVGYAVSNSPLGPFEKCKDNPVLKKTEKVVGVGHHSFFKGKNGDGYIVYHSHFSVDTFSPRTLHVGRYSFLGDKLVIDKPVEQEFLIR